MGDLALVLVELRRVEIADAVDGEPEPRHEAGRVRYLELAARGPENAGDARRRVDDAGEIGKAAGLVRLVMQRVIAACRVLDADRVVEKFAGDEIVELADAAAPFEARLHPAMRAALHRHRAARVERPGLGLAIDDAGGTADVFCGHRVDYRV